MGSAEEQLGLKSVLLKPKFYKSTALFTEQKVINLKNFKLRGENQK
jgi:hypothetical protein